MTDTLKAYEEKAERAEYGIFRYNRTVYVRSFLGFLLAVNTYPTHAEAVGAFTLLSAGRLNPSRFVNVYHAGAASFRV